MTDDWRPALARSLVLRHCNIRRADLLIMPERVVVLNDQAAEIVRLCDGTRTTSEIANVLAERYPAAPVAEDVPEFLHRIRSEGWLR